MGGRWATRPPSPMPASSRRSGRTAGRPRSSVPFGFLKRRKDDADQSASSTAGEHPDGPSTAFEGLTEEWRLVGRMHVRGRLTDALNRRESLSISDVCWAPID